MPTRLDRPGHLAATLVPPLVLIALSWAILRAQGFFLVDDAYISFRYAANLAAGHGLVWNPGEPVEGYTNLLWVLLLAPFARLGLDLTYPAAMLGTLAAAGCLDVLRRLTGRVLPAWPRLLTGLPGLLLAANPSFCYWATGGMETPLFALFCLLAVHLLLRGRDRPASLALAGLTLGAACLTRPEGALVAALLLLTELLVGGLPFRRQVLRLLGPGLMVLVVVGAQLAFRLTYYGYPFPNTFYAKVIPGWVALTRGAAHIWGFLLAGGLAALPGLVALRRGGLLRAYLIHGYVLLGVYLVYLLAIGGDLPSWFRFYVPLLPLPMLGLAVVLVELGGLASRGRAGPARRWLAALPALALLCLAPAAWQRSEISLLPGVKTAGQVGQLVVQALRAQVPDTALLAGTTIGFGGYYTPYRIIDAWGLNDAHIAHLRLRADPARKFAHDKEDWFYVLSQAPDYVISPFHGLPAPPTIPGYEICWPGLLPLKIVVYRRTVRLPPSLLGLGLPRGQRREMALPPPCVEPAGLSLPALTPPTRR
jgi:hypothetical protein